MKLEFYAKLPSKKFVNIYNEDNDLMNKYTEELGEPNIQAAQLAPQTPVTPVNPEDEQKQDPYANHMQLLNQAHQYLAGQQGSEAAIPGAEAAVGGAEGMAAGGAEIAELAPLALL